MTKFIELTKDQNTPQNDKVWLNVGLIQYIESSAVPGSVRTYVSIDPDSHDFWVKETPEEIIALILATDKAKVLDK